MAHRLRLTARASACLRTAQDSLVKMTMSNPQGGVGHEDRGPRRFDGDRHPCHHRQHRLHRRCRCRCLPRRGSGGRGQRGRPPSVVVVVIGRGGGGAVPVPAAAERAPLDHRAVPPRPLRDALSLSPSSSSHPRPPHYLPLPPPALVNCEMLPSDAADDCRATTSSSTDVDSLPLRTHTLHSIGASAPS